MVIKMNKTDLFSEIQKPNHERDRKRVTIYINKKHKRFLEDIAHTQRMKQYEVLYHILERAMGANEWMYK